MTYRTKLFFCTKYTISINCSQIDRASCACKYTHFCVFNVQYIFIYIYVYIFLVNYEDVTKHLVFLLIKIVKRKRAR